MSVQSLLGIKKAIANLNPEQVRTQADRPLRIAICAGDAQSRDRILGFLLGPLSPDRRARSVAFLHDAFQPGEAPFDLVLAAPGVPAPANAYVLGEHNGEYIVKTILKDHEELGIALARAFPPFHTAFVDLVISKTCRENTLFSLATALPDVIPSIIELPWALAEFASDTAFLTANQLRMAFLLAAASDRHVGYREQKSEVATVIAGAFGWRALARQAIGKVPFGGGLIAKSAVAYAGTKVVGLSLDRVYRIGYQYSREERKALYSDALEQGKKVAGSLLENLRPDIAAKYAAATRDKLLRRSAKADNSDIS